MVLLAAWKFAPDGQQWVGITFSVLSALTVVLTAGVHAVDDPARLLRHQPGVQELPGRRRCASWPCAVPLMVMSVLLGVLPQPFF